MSIEQHMQDNTTLSQEEAQAKAIASLLDERAQALSMRTLKHLEDSRAKALAVHAGKHAGSTIHQDGTVSRWLGWGQHHRMLSVGLLGLALLLGFGITHTLTQNNEQGDAFLLGAELPPEAFVDRGFEPWLNAKVEL